MYLFCPKNSTVNSRKTFITQKWLVVEKLCDHWLNRIFNALSIVHFNELYLAWTNYHFFCLWLKIRFLGKFYAKIQNCLCKVKFPFWGNCLFKVKFANQANSNIQNSIVMLTFHFWPKIRFWGKFCPKIQNCLCKVKFPFRANLENFSLSLNLVPTIIFITF